MSSADYISALACRRASKLVCRGQHRCVPRLAIGTREGLVMERQAISAKSCKQVWAGIWAYDELTGNYSGPEVLFEDIIPVISAKLVCGDLILATTRQLPGRVRRQFSFSVFVVRARPASLGCFVRPEASKAP